MRNMRRWWISGALVLVCAGSVVGGFSRRRSEGDGNILLMVPARYRVVQVAFDMARLRSIYLASYSDPANGSWALHVWDSASGKWLKVDRNDFSSGQVFLTRPRAAVLVGKDSDLPKELTGMLSWVPKVVRIRSLLVADLLNGLAPYLRFTPSEWKWLAKRYRLKLVDRNAERRRYGRYGPPGRRRPPAASTLEVPMPPPPDLEEDAETETPDDAGKTPEASVDSKPSAGSAPGGAARPAASAQSSPTARPPSVTPSSSTPPAGTGKAAGPDETPSTPKKKAEIIRGELPEIELPDAPSPEQTPPPPVKPEDK